MVLSALVAHGLERGCVSPSRRSSIRSAWRASRLAKPDVLHVQWLGAPELDRWLFRPRSPAVFTAHDIIPRRTLSKTAMWRTLFDRFERVVVHSERGRGQLVEFGLAAEKVRVIGHPVFRSDDRAARTTGAQRSASG